MTTATTRIDITAKDSTAAAFASANSNLSNLSSSAVQAAAAIAGIGVSFGGLASSIKSSIDAADETFKLSQKIGVAVEQIAGLELAFKQSGLGADQLQSSISKLSKNVASGSAAFDAMGVATRGADGNLKSTREILGEVSDKFAGYQDGIAKTALAIELFGKSGADVIPFLNQGAESLAEFDAMAEKLGLTLSTSTAKKAEEFNDTLSLIGQSFKGVSTRIAAEMLPTLQGLAEQFFNTATQGNNIKVVADAVTTTFKGLVAGGLAAAGAFKTVGTTLGGVAAMWAAIASGEFSQASTIVKQIKADFSDNFKSTIDNVTNAWNANGSATVEALTATQKQVQIQAPLTSELEKSTKSIEKQSKALNFQVGNLKELQAIYSRVQSITKSVETDQERYNDTLTELERLKPYLGAETYARALQKAQDELNKTAEVTKVTTDEVSQLWMQAGRNIQSTLANSIFDFFNGGLKGMVSNVKNTVLRIVSEFAGLKIAQSIGLAGMFGAAGNAAASGGGGGGFSLMNGASMASNALSLFKSGFGATDLLSSVGSKLPGSIGSFFGGMGVTGTQAAAEAGATALWGASGAGAAASLGSSVAAFAGPAVALFAVDAIGRLFGGNKKLGGAEMIPVIGGFLAGLFGRGPLKQKETQLTGDVGAEGLLSGYLTTNFKAKGGLLVGSKRDFAGVNLLTGAAETDNNKALGSVADGMVKYAQNLALQINDSVKSTNTSLRSLSDTLGLSTKPLDDFKHSINLISESGKALTDQQIADEIAKISDEMVRSLLPSVDQLGKYGETSAQTISRLGSEFKALETGAQNLGASAGYANELIKSMSFEARSAFVDQAGGIDALLQKTGYFFDNFLTPAEQMSLKSDQLSAALKKLGVSADLTMDQFKKLVQSTSTSNDLRIGLLGLSQAFYEVKNAQVQVTQSTLETAKVLNIRSADDTEYGQRLNKSIQDTSASIKELEGVAAQLAGTVNSIRPMSVEDARKLVSSGNRNDPNFQAALSVLSGMGSKGFSNVLDFRRAQGQNLAAIGSVQDSTQSQIDSQRKQLAQFEFEKQMLQEGLARAGNAFFNSIAKFDTGTSYVPKTGMAIIHKGERVVSNSQNKDLTALLGQLVNVMSGNSKSTDDMYKLLRRLTDGGNSLRTTGAA